MARIIPKRVLEDIRFRNDIVEVVGSYFNLQRAGSAFKALCPFHKEKTPSFHVNPERQIFHCFGCGAGGDVFRFLMQYEGVDFVTSAKMLAQRTGIALELEEGEERDSDKTVLYNLHSEVAALYHRALLERKSATNARQYLRQRDLTAKTIEQFLIGYAPDRWDAVLRWAQKNKYAMKQVERAGLILKKSTASGSDTDYYDRFRNRLMFPIFDIQGRVIGFSGRSLDDSDTGAKYVNSPETPLFRKSRVLYALEKAHRNIAESREAIICEGQIDVIRCHQAGFDTAVASQGTACTEDHVRILRRYADSVCIVFDPDKAGQDAAIRTATIFIGNGLAVRIADLPGDEDPDSFIRGNGAEAFRKILDEGKSAVSYQIRVLSTREDPTHEIGTMRIAKAVLHTISHSPNAVQRAKLVQEAGQRLNLPITALQDDLRYMLRQKTRSYRPTEVSAEKTEPPGREPPAEELALCEHMVHVIDHPELGTLIEKYLPPDMLTDESCREVVKASIESAESGRDIQDILRVVDDASGDLEKFAVRVRETPIKIVGNETTREDAVKDLILCVWRKSLEQERAGLEKKKDKKPGGEEEERCRQITYDLKALRKWEDGSPIIEIEMTG